VERAPGRESLRLMRHIGWVRRRQAAAECRIAGLGGMAGPLSLRPVVVLGVLP
jgi:hypothetical protein